MSIYKSAAPALRSDTRMQAYHAVQQNRSYMQSLILDVLENTGGATCDFVEGATCFPHQTVSARITELRDAGAIYDSGERRKTRSGRSAVVWKVRK